MAARPPSPGLSDTTPTAPSTPCRPAARAPSSRETHLGWHLILYSVNKLVLPLRLRFCHGASCTPLLLLLHSALQLGAGSPPGNATMTPSPLLFARCAGRGGTRGSSWLAQLHAMQGHGNAGNLGRSATGRPALGQAIQHWHLLAAGTCKQYGWDWPFQPVAARQRARAPCSEAQAAPSPQLKQRRRPGGAAPGPPRIDRPRRRRGARRAVAPPDQPQSGPPGRALQPPPLRRASAVLLRPAARASRLGERCPGRAEAIDMTAQMQRSCLQALRRRGNVSVLRY